MFTVDIEELVMPSVYLMLCLDNHTFTQIIYQKNT